MVCYIYCKINDRELMVNEDDAEDIKSFMTRSNQYDKVGKEYLTKLQKEVKQKMSIKLYGLGKIYIYIV